MQSGADTHEAEVAATRPSGRVAGSGAASNDETSATTLRTSNSVNTIIHLYRSEIGRLVAYRMRLDTTTNWAISSSALAATIAFGRNELTHVPFLFLMLLLYFFLHLEARRFRHYEAARHRALLLEQMLYPEVVGAPVDRTWNRKTASALLGPPPDVPLLAALGWRLRRNYIWIYSVVLLAWISKLDVEHGPTWDIAEFITRASIGSLPGWSVFAIVCTCYAWMASLALLAYRRYPEGDETIRAYQPGMAD